MPNNEFSIQETKNSLLRIILLLLVLVIVVLLTVGAYFFTKINQATSSTSVPVNFTVPKGGNSRTIAKALSDENVINSYWGFILYVKIHHADSNIQAGTYMLDSNMNIPQIVDILTAGKVVPSNRNVTIVEGMVNAQIGADLENRNIVSQKDFNTALANSNYDFNYNDLGQKFKYQGFLFPDTYELSKDVTASSLVQEMLTNFESKITPQMTADMQAKNLTMSDVIILASIIEKEVGRNKTNITQQDLTTMSQERRLVASVFYNRLNIGMPLESDATVNYVTGKSDPSVSIDDTKIDSPYNTYKYKGLPPTPISNPGLDSIMAAIYPTKSDYLYFLNAPDGTAYFAKTLAEQNANKQKYLK